MAHSISKLKGTTIESIKVISTGPNASYGLPVEVVITANDGYIYRIDMNGLDGGECGHYPGLNFSRTKKEDK